MLVTKQLHRRLHPNGLNFRRIPPTMLQGPTSDVPGSTFHSTYTCVEQRQERDWALAVVQAWWSASCMMAARPALVCAVGLLLLLSSASAQSNTACKIAPATPISTTGVWNGWAPLLNQGLNNFIDPAVQNQTVASQAACNCNCAQAKNCLGYVLLGGSQCWLQSQIDFEKPLETVLTDANQVSGAAIPAGTVVARVVKDSSTKWPLCTKLSSSKANTSFTGVQDSSVTGLVTTEAECNQLCGGRSTCIAYTWVQTSQVCTTFSSVNASIPLVGTTAAPLQQCGESLVAFPSPPPPSPPPSPPPPFPPLPPAPPIVAGKSCNIDAAPGVIREGQVLEDWRPLKDAGILTITSFTNEDIPETVQGKPTSSAGECNCVCNSVSQCVGYTWLGGTSQECWLHSFVDWARNFSSTYLDWTDNAPVAVEKDAVVARVIKDTPWPLCDKMVKTEAAKFATFSSEKIRKPVVGLVNMSACNQACGNDPYCVGWQRFQKDVKDKKELAACQLLSSVGPVYNNPTQGNTTQLIAVLNNCFENLPLASASLLSNTVDVPPAPTPTPTNFLADSAPTGKCGIDARPGIRYQDKVFAGFKNQFGIGANGELPLGTTKESLSASIIYTDPVSTSGIDSKDQGLRFADPQDCNCQCARSQNCVGYVWLGDSQLCWLLSWVRFWDDPVTQFLDQSSGSSNLVDVPKNTVAARVVKYNADDAKTQWDSLTSAFGTPSSQNFTCQNMLTYSRQGPATASSTRITRQPGQPVLSQECNAACLLDPYCVAFSWSGLNYDEKAVCQLFSEVSGGLVNVTGGATYQNFSAVLQTCIENKLNLTNLSPVIAPAPSNKTAPVSCGISSADGVRATGVVWSDWVPVYGFGGNLETVSIGAPQASNSYIPNNIQGLITAFPDECNCRCASQPACIGYTWLGGDRTECWLHSSVNFWTTPVSSFLDPNNLSTSGKSPVPANTVIGRVVLPAGSSRQKSCGESFSPSVIQDADFINPISTGLSQPNRLVTIVQCNDLCVQQPKCTLFVFRTKDTTLQATPGNCTLLSGAGTYESKASVLDEHFYAAPVQVCSAALVSPPAAPVPPTPPAFNNTNTTAANWTAGVRYTGAVWPGWQRTYRAGQQILQSNNGILSWSNTTSSSSRRRLQALDTGTAWSNNYIPDDQQALKTASAEQCNQRCATIKACIAYTWLGGDIQECWLQSFVQFWDTPSATYLDANNNAQGVPADTVVARVVKPDWSPCQKQMNWFPKLAPVNGSSKGITRPNPVRTGDISACNAECGRDPACIAFSFHGPPPADNSAVNCQLYSNIAGGLTPNSSRSFITYTVPLQACPQDLNDLSGTAPTPPGFNPALVPGGSGSGKSLSSGALAGIVVGCVLGALAILVIGAVIWTRYSKQKERERFYGPLGNKSSISAGDTKDSIWSMGMTDTAGKHVPMAVPGLAKGEIFTRATAYEYSWQMDTLDENQIQAVEASINDRQLDAMLKDETNPNALPPVVELSKDDLRKQVQLVHGGLLGRGATALVFQCVWPSRFGPNALLAAKVLKDGHEVDPLVLQSFAYEANVLASTEHPCVVRLYGYCLEPPTVCLILELLPYSLKDLLYGIQTQADSTTRAMHPSLRALSLSSNNPLLLIHFTNTSGMQTPKSEVPVVVVVDEDGKPSPQSGAVTSRDTLGSRGHSSPGSPETGTGTGAAVPLLHSPNGRPPALMIENSNRDTGLGNGTVMTTPTAGPMPSPGTRPPPLSMLQVVRISAEIAAGLAYLHDRQLYNVNDKAPGHQVVTLESSSMMTSTMNQQGLKIVHRDLKPANILMNSQGRAKISDFGLARKTQRTTVHTERLGAGTLPYMAPELLAGANSGNTYKLAPTNRVDIYSLSMMMWEMVSGKQPWSDKNEVAIMSAVIRNQRPELPQMPREVVEGEKPDLEHLPASLYALPEFNTLVRAAWNQRELKRPTAAALYHKLCDLLRSYGYNPPADLVVMTPSLGPQEPEESPV